MTHEVAVTYPVTNLKGKLTLAGAIHRYWPQISRNWFADRTIAGNISDYERRILSEADPLKAMGEYTSGDFDEIIKTLETAGDYKEGTTNHYRHLINLIIESCLEANEDIDTSLIDEDNSEKAAKEGLVRSLTENEEKMMFEWVESLDPETVTGPEIGVAVMFILGVRNHEAAGMTFGSMYYDNNYKAYMMRVIMTTKGKTRRTKSKTKTSNGHRAIPILFEVLVNLIEGRKKFIMAECGLAETDLYMMPLCCSPYNPKQHCTYEEINQAAKQIFRLLGINGNKWSLLLSEEDAAGIIAEEKDPTAYLLRRNAATRYYSLWLTEAEIHYIMGHEIDATGTIRSDYTNSRLMKPIIDKIGKHKHCR